MLFRPSRRAAGKAVESKPRSAGSARSAPPVPSPAPAPPPQPAAGHDRQLRKRPNRDCRSQPQVRAEKKPAPNVKIHSVLHNEYHEHIRPGDVCWVSWYSGAELKSEADKDFSPVFVKSILGHRLEDGLARLKCTWLLRMDRYTTHIVEREFFFLVSKEV